MHLILGLTLRQCQCSPEQVRPQTATQLDGVIASHRASIASDAGASSGPIPSRISGRHQGHFWGISGRPSENLPEIRPRYTCPEIRYASDVLTWNAGARSAVALRRSTGSNWVSEALVRDEKDRKTFGRTPSAVEDARTGHEKRLVRRANTALTSTQAATNCCCSRFHDC